MKNHRPLISAAALLLAALQFSLFQPAPASAAASPIAKALQPFVDKEELAGAVALVANQEKILAVEAVGFADQLRITRIARIKKRSPQS